MTIRTWWRESRAQYKRETDERARAIGALVARDGFIAGMLLVGALALAQALVDRETLRTHAADILALFPLIWIIVVGAVLGVSGALRGGFGGSGRAIAYGDLMHLFGTLVGVGIIVALSSFGFGPPLGSVWASLLGIVLGTILAMTVRRLVRRRRGQ